MEKVKLSIIIPVYNVEKYLEDCLGSVFLKKEPDNEVIIVNDGSTDGSLQIAKKFADKHLNTTLIDKVNGGISSARNAGINAAKGEYIGFIDSDDFILPGMFQSLYELAIKHRADIVKCGFYVFDDKSKELYKQRIRFKKFKLLDSKADLLKDYYRKYINKAVWNGIYKKDLFQNIKFKINTDFEDYYITPEVLAACNRFVYTPKSWMFYRRRGTSMSLTYKKSTLADRVKALSDNYNLLKNESLLNSTILELFDKNFTNEILFYHNIMMKKYRKSLLGQYNISSLLDEKLFNDIYERGNISRLEILKLKMIYDSHIRFYLFDKTLSILNRFIPSNNQKSEKGLKPVVNISDYEYTFFENYA